MAVSKKIPKLVFAKYIKDEKKDCKDFLDLKLKPPLLVVGSPYNQFSKKFKVLKLQHQTGGIMCHHHYMYAVVLPQSDFLIKNIDAFESRFGEHNFSIFGNNLSDYNKYNNFLKGKLKLTGCEDNFHYLEEAIYPITFNYKNLTTLSSIKLPDTVKEDDDLINYFCDPEQTRLPMVRFNLFVLTENSD